MHTFIRERSGQLLSIDGLADFLHLDKGASKAAPKGRLKRERRRGHPGLSASAVASAMEPRGHEQFLAMVEEKRTCSPPAPSILHAKLDDELGKRAAAESELLASSFTQKST